MTVNFSSPVNVNKLHLYDSQAGALGPPDVTVVGATTGPVSGSLVLDATGQKLTFLPTSTFTPATDTIRGRAGALTPTPSRCFRVPTASRIFPAIRWSAMVRPAAIMSPP